MSLVFVMRDEQKDAWEKRAGNGRMDQKKGGNVTHNSE